MPGSDELSGTIMTPELLRRRNCEIFVILKVVCAREPESFWREKVVAVVILLLVLAGISKWGKQVIKC